MQFFEQVLPRISHLSVKDLIDIFLVAFVIYRFLLLIKGTRGMQMAVGIEFLVLFYYVAKLGQLQATEWLLTNFLTYIVFAIIVLYQMEIRRGLAQIGRTPLWRRFAGRRPREPYEEIILAATTLSAQKIGGLIVIEGAIGLKNYIETGIRLDALLTYDLLVSIFNPRVPLHDGAVIVQSDRVAAAGCYLPLTLDPQLSKELGTRHRAGIGITEETDALAIIVSEETGTISAAVDGTIQRNLDSTALREVIQKAFASKLGPGVEATRQTQEVA